MDMLLEIRGKVRRRQYEFSKHAVDQSIIRNIAVAELEEAISSRSEIIEDYPDDKYGQAAWFWDSRRLDGRCMFNAAIPAGC